MTQAIDLPLDLIGHEFEKSCQLQNDDNSICGEPAAWMVWQSHESFLNHASSVDRYACEAHKNRAEGNFTQYVRDLCNCTCGYQITGQLSDNFRAIRL